MSKEKTQSVYVPNIPEEGQWLNFSAQDPWVQLILAQDLQEWGGLEASLEGRIHLQRTNANDTLKGQVKYCLKPSCHRCGRVFDYVQDLAWSCYLVPHFKLPERFSKKEGEDLELSQEDLDFACYQGEHLELGPLLAQEILLDFPMSFLCGEDCQGLCARCGKNLNQASCQCPAASEDSPFAALRQLSVKAKKN